MGSAFRLLRLRCGLSQKEAATLLRVSESSIHNWDQGRRTAPPGVIDDLRRLYLQIESAAQQTLILIDSGAERTEIEIGLAADDYEAQRLGLPCVGAHEALIGLVIALSDRAIKIVPRGTTSATAGAIQAREAP